MVMIILDPTQTPKVAREVVLVTIPTRKIFAGDRSGENSLTLKLDDKP